MNKRNAGLFVLFGVAAAATLLAGCVAQYRNPGACEQEMRRRLADASQGELSVTHSAVAYRGARVVVEGQLKKTPQAAGGTGASGVAAGAGATATPAARVSAQDDAARGQAASAVAAPGAVEAADVGQGATPGTSGAAEGAVSVPPDAAHAAVPATASGTRADASELAAASSVTAGGRARVASAAGAASGTAGASNPSKPTTPIAAIAAKLGLRKPVRTPTAAECTFDESGLVSFRWLAPPVLAKTTPAPHSAAGDDE